MGSSGKKCTYWFYPAERLLGTDNRSVTVFVFNIGCLINGVWKLQAGKLAPFRHSDSAFSRYGLSGKSGRPTRRCPHILKLQKVKLYTRVYFIHGDSSYGNRPTLSAVSKQ